MPKELAGDVRHAYQLFILMWLAGCGAGGSDSAPAPDVAKYTIGGTMSGLSGSVVLQDNGGNDLTVSANAGFTFAKTTATGGNYSVTVLKQPAGQTCAVANGAGTVSGSDVIGVTVTCTSSIAPASLALLAGNMVASGSADGVGAAAAFSGPSGVATDSMGNVYVADSSNNTIRKITPSGVVTTLAGTAGVRGFNDGTGAAASFTAPYGGATDGADNLYATHTSDQIIVKKTPAGAITTLAGTVGVTGSTDANGAAASFNFPLGAATDGAGNVYVADTANHTIRKITPAGTVSTVVGVAGQQGFAAGLLPGLLSSLRAVAVSGTSLYVTLGNGLAVVKDLP